MFAKKSKKEKNILFGKALDHTISNMQQMLKIFSRNRVKNLKQYIRYLKVKLINFIFKTKQQFVFCPNEHDSFRKEK